MHRYNAGLDAFVQEINGAKLLGGFYKAAGHGRRPTAIFLHGIPGVEKNMDLAYQLRETGWNALYFHYRGCWGSGGNYNLLEQGADLQAALHWILQQPSVDPDRLMLIGSSLGGYNTLVYGAREPRFRYLVALCPLIDPQAMVLPETTVSQFAEMLHGVTASQLQTQWRQLPSVSDLIPQLTHRNLLLITGDRDEIFPPAHYATFLKSLATLTHVRHADADHQFSACRPWLRKTVLEWITKIDQ